jgi:hypothetical protein
VHVVTALLPYGAVGRSLAEPPRTSAGADAAEKEELSLCRAQVVTRGSLSDRYAAKDHRGRNGFP